MNNLISLGKTIITTDRPNLPHCHPYLEIVLYREGRGEAIIGDQNIPFHKNTVICTPAGILHCEKSAEEYASTWIQVKSPENYLSKVFVIQDPEHRPFSAISELLYKEYHLQKGNYQDICGQLVILLIFYLRQHLDNHSKNSYIEKIENILIENIQNHNFSLKKSLSVINLSMPYLIRLFKKHTGQ
ncbi:MAG: hypothetical protein A2096_11965 [Spirochaetes bacterium GWF1_41_5]|nr:MAG: hypothetical protein A2096_11965 [Spirochaetes bacterium GWF1_41_5]HBE00986.1 hypothetical protein [Spirochaetia bacterium]